MACDLAPVPASTVLELVVVRVRARELAPLPASTARLALVPVVMVVHALPVCGLMGSWAGHVG